jgi:hypothetical protein
MESLWWLLMAVAVFGPAWVFAQEDEPFPPAGPRGRAGAALGVALAVAVAAVLAVGAGRVRGLTPVPELVVPVPPVSEASDRRELAARLLDGGGADTTPGLPQRRVVSELPAHVTFRLPAATAVQVGATDAGVSDSVQGPRDDVVLELWDARGRVMHAWDDMREATPELPAGRYVLEVRPYGRRRPDFSAGSHLTAAERRRGKPDTVALPAPEAAEILPELLRALGLRRFARAVPAPGGRVRTTGRVPSTVDSSPASAVRAGSSARRRLAPGAMHFGTSSG